MARILILGAGVAGHTAAMYAKKMLKNHEVTVVSPNSKWNWIPSNIWVGVGKMRQDQVVFPLAPVYKRKGIEYHQAKAVAIRPEGNEADGTGAVEVVYTGQNKQGESARLRYDFLINATGPQLKFDMTPGLVQTADIRSRFAPTHMRTRPAPD